MTDRELMQQALDALDLHAKQYPHMVKGYTADAAEAIRARLAQSEQEPVAWVECDGQLVWNNREAAIGRNLYTAPPQREWQGLTDEEIENCFEMSMFGTCRAIEAKLKEKNT